MSIPHHIALDTAVTAVPGQAIINYLQTMKATDMLVTPIEVIEVDAPVFPSDNRLDIAIMLDASGDYRLPRASAEGMIAELSSRALHEEDGSYYPCWNIKMNFAWNKSGTMRDNIGHETRLEFDEMWDDAIENDPSIFETACARALEPWTSDYVDLLECDGDLICDISLAKDADVLILKSLSSDNLGKFSLPSRNAWAQFVTSLDNDALSKLWTACRVLDEDFSRKERAISMEREFNTIRFEKEQDWVHGVEYLDFD